MAVAKRQASVAVDLGGVMGRRRSSDRRAVHDQHRYRRCHVHGEPGDGAGARRLGAGAGHRQYGRGGAAVPKIVETLDKFGVRVPIIGDFHYNGHILLQEVSRVRAGAGEVSHQSGQRQYRQEARRQFPHHDRGGDRIRPAGAHRRQLGFARSGAADAHDGRKLAPAGAAGRQAR